MDPVENTSPQSGETPGNAPLPLSDVQSTLPALAGATGLQPSQAPEVVIPHVGLLLPVLALVIPVIAGIAGFFVETFGTSLWIGIVTVVTTAILLTIDAARLGQVDRSGSKREPAYVIFLGMILLWIVVYISVLFRRRQFRGPHLGYYAILSGVMMIGAPFCRPLLVPPSLPACASQEVQQLIRQVVGNTPIGFKVKSIDGFREVSYNPDSDVRTGECIIRTSTEATRYFYLVQWTDRERRQFEVRIVGTELPLCNSPEVVRVVEQVIRGMPAFANATAIKGYAEVRYDAQANRREGQCTVQTPAKEIPVRFVIEWTDQAQGKFSVRVNAVP